jgi:HAD superfamily 5'-nucleotidase-like hydrolase
MSVTKKCIGFDLDHTIVRYKLDAFHELMFNTCRDVLVQQHGSYASLISDSVYDSKFCVKGLVYDVLLGNLIAFDMDRIPTVVTHGKTILSEDQVSTIYTFEVCTSYDGTPQHPRWKPLHSSFEAPLGSLISELVQKIDDSSQPQQLPPVNVYSELWCHIRATYGVMFGNFDTSPYFRAIRESPSKYLEKRDELHGWLSQMRNCSDDERPWLFLLTNSGWKYANCIATYALGKNWTQLFDLIVVDGSKPGFFATDDKFRCHETNNEVDDPVEISRKVALCGGSYHHLKALLDMTFIDIPYEVTYVGDHVITDIYGTSQHTPWTTVGIWEPTTSQPSTIFGSCTKCFSYDLMQSLSKLVVQDVVKMLSK